MTHLRLTVYGIISCLVLTAACDFYEPPRDASEFVSAGLTDGQTVVFSFNRSAYRMAKGIAAFPDGGKARYVEDVNILGAFHIPSGRLTILREEKNTEWQNGQGHFFVVLVNGPMAWVSQGGQHRKTYMPYNKHFLVNIQTQHMQEVPIREDLAVRGRAFSEIYLIDGQGTLLLISPSVEEHQREMFWRRNASIVPEIWVRCPDGEYALAARTRHYERVENGEVIYWIAETRTFMAYNLQTRQTRSLKNYRNPPYRDVAEGVSVSTHGEHLSYGTKVGDRWQYAPIALTKEMLGN